MRKVNKCWTCYHLQFFVINTIILYKIIIVMYSLITNHNFIVVFQDKLLDLLLHIKQQNNTIISLLNKKSTIGISSGAHLPNNLPVTLPLKTQDDVDTLEVLYLENNDNRNFMVCILFIELFISIC